VQHAALMGKIAPAREPGGSLVDEQNKQSILDLPKVIAGGIASPAAALLTSRFGVAGTVVGLAFSAVIVTVISDVLKVYLARAPGAVVSIPGGFSKKPTWQQMLYRLRQPFSKFASLAPPTRRSILIRSVIAGIIMFVVGLAVVTGLEVGVGKDLSCWVWKNCPAETSTSGSSAWNTSTGTLPSILGGGSSAKGNAQQQVVPANPAQPTPAPQQPTPTPQQQTPNPGSPETPVQSPNVPNVQGSPGPLPQPSQQQSPSEGPGNQQPVSSGSSGNQQPGGVPVPPVSKGSNNQ
jgi:hypothetical protein